MIYEHRPASLAAAQLMNALKPVLAEAGKGAGTPFERDVVTVLRRVAESVTKVRAVETGNARAFLDVLGRVIQATFQSQRGAALVGINVPLFHALMWGCPWS